jgi:hypothetical protein
LTHRSARCPSRSPACPISTNCAPAGHLRAWVRHLRFGARASQDGLQRHAMRHAIGCVCVTSWVRPCRTIESTPIAALPELFTHLSYLKSLCVRRAAARVGCGTRVPVIVGFRRAVAGCDVARDRMRVFHVVGSALQDDREHADRRAARVVHQLVPAPLSVRSPGTLRAWVLLLRVRCALESGALWLDAVRHAIRCACADVVGSAVQGDHEHADRRTARVVRQPVPAHLYVRPPGTCARGCGTCASGALWSRPGCGWMRCGTRSDERERRRGFGRAGRSLTLRSPRCPSRSAACPSSTNCACAGHLRAWMRHKHA